MFYDDDYSYYSFEEEQVPEVFYDPTQAQTTAPSPVTPPPQPADNDPSVVKFYSINSSRQYIQTNLNIQPNQLRQLDLPGLVILRMSDYSLLRNDSRCHRIVPHLFVVANTDDFISRHPEFATCIQVLNQ